MGIVVDAISGRDIANIVKNNIDKPLDLSDVGVKGFFSGLLKSIGDNKISVLRIWSHGTTHYSDKFETPYNKGNIRFADDQVDDGTVEKYKIDLSSLQSHLDAGSRVELRGCQAALTSGANMMLKLADIWKTEVQGSDRSQPLLTWTPPVYSARPGAKALSWAIIVEYNDPRFKK